jgi:bifunctional pyridoxal-dependent enzyme with beta-cystathionase and maltose regulon repressor activities
LGFALTLFHFVLYLGVLYAVRPTFMNPTPSQKVDLKITESSETKLWNFCEHESWLTVFDESHLEAILAIADKHFLPIIADEIYEHFVFEGSKKKYLPLASLTSTVPILSCGGLTKRYLIPGTVTIRLSDNPESIHK